MHKCFKCGTEFEGAFCPECGTKWQEEKVCPQCNALLAGNAKFCNHCGYAFAVPSQGQGGNAPNKIGALIKKAIGWIKSHLKIVVPAAIAAVALITLLSLIPTFILMSVNGTYYAYSFDKDGEIVFREESYVTLTTGKWKDDEGMEGKYKLSGKKITFITEIDDEDMKDLIGELGGDVNLKGTCENGVLTIEIPLGQDRYAKKNHTHKYGKWEVTQASTCTVMGTQQRVCACEKAEKERIALAAHTLDDDYLCAVCGTKFTKGLEYRLNEDEKSYSVAGIGTAKDSEIVIMDLFDGKPVTRIGYQAFYNRFFTSITIPNSVTSIGGRAFESCYSLTSITIPESVTSIGSSAFHDCSRLTSITIPNSVTSIGGGAFSGCSELTSIVDDNNQNYSSQDGILYNKAKTQIISAFGKISGAVTIPNSVTSIESRAFYGCSGPTSITIPNSVTSIGDDAFTWCGSLASITVDDNNQNYSSQDGILYDKAKTQIIQVPHAISGAVTIPNSITSIGNYAFSNCSGLTSITIPESVTSIGDYAFILCSSLTSTTIPNSVTSIGNSAFSYCSGLTSITIPNSVTSIGSSAFYGCDNLQYNDYDNAKYLGNSENPYLALINATNRSITSCTINENTKVICGSAFSNCSGLTSITIPESVTSIGDYAFILCSSLTSITIPNSVTSIGENAFYNCRSLTSITVGNSVTSIGEYAFEGCSNLQYNDYDNAKYLGNSENPYVVLIKAMDTSITSCTINENTKVIYAGAFSNYGWLTSITIPNGVTSIGGYAFFNCRDLTRIDFNGTKAQWKAISKESGWDNYTGNYTIYCTDGNLRKS